MRSRIRCTECGLPVTCGQGTRHLSCSPVCPNCQGRIQSHGHKCPAKKKSETS